MVVAREVTGADGHAAFAKGHVLQPDDVPRLVALPWEELHLVECEPGELHEGDAGIRIARAAAGEHVAVGPLGGGHWPLSATRRGILRVAIEPLARVNAIQGACVYTRFDGQIVDRDTVVARAKVIPLVLDSDHVTAVERIAGETSGLVRVAPFQPRVVGVIVQESLDARAASRFAQSLTDKVTWLGSRLLPPYYVASDPAAIGGAIDAAAADGAQVILMAGTKALDPLDPAFQALEHLGVRLDRFGVPAHPGSLFWLAHWRERPLLGLPTCGLFAQLTTFDVIFPRLLAGERVDAATLAALGHGGLMARDVSFFPPYPPAVSGGPT